MPKRKPPREMLKDAEDIACEMHMATVHFARQFGYDPTKLPLWNELPEKRRKLAIHAAYELLVNGIIFKRPPIRESVNIAYCPVHGLHGQRTLCFTCEQDVEQVPMLPLHPYGEDT